MEKDYIIINPHGKRIVVPEKVALSFRGQVVIVGEIIETKYKNRGTGEVISQQEFWKRCIKNVERKDGKMIRIVEKGWIPLYTIDKSKRPIGDPRKDRVALDRGQGMKEVPRDKWERNRK